MRLRAGDGVGDCGVVARAPLGAGAEIADIVVAAHLLGRGRDPGIELVDGGLIVEREIRVLDGGAACIGIGRFRCAGPESGAEREHRGGDEAKMTCGLHGGILLGGCALQCSLPRSAA